MTLLGHTIGPRLDGFYHPLEMTTERGIVEARWYPVRPAGRTTGHMAGRAALFVGGVGGGFDTPARKLYPVLARELAGDDAVAGLRVRFHRPGQLGDAVADVLDGIAFLAGQGIERIALVGHSFGGAVVIQAAATAEPVRAVVTLATQGFGAHPVAELAGRCAVLLIHGTDDAILAPSNSEYVHRLAGDPKRLVLLDGADHVLDDAAERVHTEVRDWIVRHTREHAEQ